MLAGHYSVTLVLYVARLYIQLHNAWNIIFVCEFFPLKLAVPSRLVVCYVMFITIIFIAIDFLLTFWHEASFS